MTEEFLQFIWKYKLFSPVCKSTDGKKIQILKSGDCNTDAGPDFINAKVKIGNTVWAGNIEIHLNSSDWYLHMHQNDKFYNNVILHVVYNHDKDIFRGGVNSHEIIPTLVLKGLFNVNLYLNYKLIKESRNSIPCAKLINNVNKIVFNSWLEALLIERLEKKTESISQNLAKLDFNWEEAFYRHLAANFGFKLNAQPFAMLASSLPFKYISKLKDNIFQIEALLFGQAGLLSKDFIDDYPSKLKKEYAYLRCKFDINPIEPHLWKFLRLMPSGFPFIRIAQFAALLHNNDNLFSKIIDAKNIRSIKKIFNVNLSDYWTNHYVFDRISKPKNKNPGNDTVENIIINSVVPFLFIYGIRKDNYTYKEKALKFLEDIPAEKNHILNEWKKIGIIASNAFDSQALIELKNEYCNLKKCLSCRIGNSILARSIEHLK